MSDQPLLALDIGTRKVVGLLTIPTSKGLKIVAAEKIEHATRAMFDGQIHDVLQVAHVVERVVNKLSAKAGVVLTEAAVAAAGRALRTFKGTATRELSGLTELTHDQVFSMELEAVQAAQGAMATALSDRENAQDYHYVGHSTMGMRLDGLTIGNLVGQRGSLAELDVIATFLPRGVVDSLQAVLQRAGLEMTALTLEPIAALTVAVPQSMRHLNLVLVDIGAGTSDIAITNKGTVTAYDMVPVAGDEITEALSEAYLLDFGVGESVKRSIMTSESVTFTDILGQKQTIPAEALVDGLRPAVQRLAHLIAERILNLNGGPPQAVMLVGGGSLTPGLSAALAAAVGLPESRVAVRGRDAVQGVVGAKGLLNGPDAVTPIGIAVASRNQSTLGFHLVHVNERGIRLFHPSKLTVGDALLAAGIAIKDLQGRVGKGLTVSVNGNLHIIRGTFGKPARVLINGELATLDTGVSHRDQVTVVPGTEGDQGKAQVCDIAPAANQRLAIKVNGELHQLAALVTVNGNEGSSDRELSDNDSVVVRPLQTIEDALMVLGWEDAGELDSVRYSVNGSSYVDRRLRYRISCNGGDATPEAPIRDGDHLLVQHSSRLTVGEAISMVAGEVGSLLVSVNGQSVVMRHDDPVVQRNGHPVSLLEPVAENDQLVVEERDAGPIFAHLLAEVGVTVNPPPGKSRLAMLVNGQPAEFTTILHDGDVVDIAWE